MLLLKVTEYCFYLERECNEYDDGDFDELGRGYVMLQELDKNKPFST